MKSRLNMPDNLKSLVEKQNLTKMKVPYIEVNYKPIDNDDNNTLLQFPKLSLDDLYHISLGPSRAK